ncbi:carbohydrate ABC transporter permease [Streptomyces sp. NBC_01549]|uniref:carbohydrate ABC transporter permease n=1 Tax=Streptomyces sp. NBC_01549 TaxID=2975874 RepID=UPI002250158D|nr:carbohydrate ABC transporter permease [Streptomyces sp. NBC_01549]MCX4591351.1 carbohydrate ABC transporter permease [Streptomyces sp. NBC_01549]
MASASSAPARPDCRRMPLLRSLVLQAARIVLALFFAFPIVFMLVSSLKPDQQIFGDLDSIKAFLPVGHLSLDNYTGVFDRVPAARFLITSIGISAVTVVLGIFVNSLAAFALSRMRWRGKKVVLAAIIATLIVPFETFALPLVWWVNQLPWLQVNGFHLALTEGWLDTYRVQVLPFVANAFSVFLFHQYFQSIPKELDEAAIIDGAGWFGIYRRIVMPLSSPAIATVAILTLLPAWNSYLWPLMVVQSENLRPVMVGTQYFFQLNPSWGQIMAYASITVPVLTLFVAFQRAFVNSIASSGVKADRRGARLPGRSSHSLLCPHAVLQRTL